STAVSAAGSLLVGTNEASFVLLLDRNDVEFLFAADIDARTENKIVESRAPIDIDVLKVPHHGSKYSSSAELLDAATPLLSVISVGARNRFGHPTKAAIDRMTSVGSEIMRTDRSGAVIVEVAGDSIFCTGFCGGRALRFSGEDQPVRPLP
ncbi:hypothetical protein J7L01_03200, partial [bacterium]|nr:hypothetical protein [bacterium]